MNEQIKESTYRPIIGGKKRRRGIGGAKGRRINPEYDRLAMGYDFPRGEVTQKQRQAISALIVKHIRIATILQHPDHTARTLGMVMGLEDRQAKKLVAEARNLEVPPAAALALDVLRQMASGSIPSAIDFPESTDCRALLESVFESRLDPFGDALSVSWLRGQSHTILQLHNAFRRDYLTRERRRLHQQENRQRRESEASDAA